MLVSTTTAATRVKDCHSPEGLTRPTRPTHSDGRHIVIPRTSCGSAHGGTVCLVMAAEAARMAT
jgi:hypothetical protein